MFVSLTHLAQGRRRVGLNAGRIGILGFFYTFTFYTYFTLTLNFTYTFGAG